MRISPLLHLTHPSFHTELLLAIKSGLSAYCSIIECYQINLTKGMSVHVRDYVGLP